MAVVIPNSPANPFNGYGVQQQEMLRRKASQLYMNHAFNESASEYGPATIVDLSPLADRVMNRPVKEAS